MYETAVVHPIAARFCSSSHASIMASVVELSVSALVYEYLLKKDASLAKVFQKKTKAVRF